MQGQRHPIPAQACDGASDRRSEAGRKVEAACRFAGQTGRPGHVGALADAVAILAAMPGPGSIPRKQVIVHAPISVLVAVSSKASGEPGVAQVAAILDAAC